MIYAVQIRALESAWMCILNVHPNSAYSELHYLTELYLRLLICNRDDSNITQHCPRNQMNTQSAWPIVNAQEVFIIDIDT